MPKAKWVLATAAVSMIVSALVIRAWVKAPQGGTVAKLLGGS